MGRTEPEWPYGRSLRVDGCGIVVGKLSGNLHERDGYCRRWRGDRILSRSSTKLHTLFRAPPIMSAAATTIQTESHGRVRRVLVNDLTVLRSGPSLMALSHLLSKE